MGRYLVTGLVSRHANPRKNKRDVLVSWLLAEALRDLGHEVEHRNPTIGESYEEFDHVFLGLAALHSVGANRTYGWLAAYLKTFADGRVTFFVDDTDTAKVLSGLRVMNSDPAKLVKPYYVYRLEYQTAVQPAVHEWLTQGVSNLHDYAWPRVIVPLFPWGDVEHFKRRLPNATDVVGIDFSAYVPFYARDCVAETAVERQWVAEVGRRNDWLDTVRPVFPVIRLGKDYSKRPEDEGLVHLYENSWGVLDRGPDHGFFNSRPLYAAQAQTLYVTKWQNMRTLGDAYGILADRAAEFTPAEREQWTLFQAESLFAQTHSREHVKDVLSSLLADKVLS